VAQGLPFGPFLHIRERNMFTCLLVTRLHIYIYIVACVGACVAGVLVDFLFVSGDVLIASRSRSCT